MDKTRSEILRTLGNIERFAQKLSEEATELNKEVMGSCDLMGAWQMVWNLRARIWEDPDGTWQRILAVSQDARQKHEVIRMVAYEPETYGPLRISWLRGDDRARTAAKEPYERLKKGYSASGEYAVLRAGELMLTAQRLESMNRSLKAMLTADGTDSDVSWISDLLREAAMPQKQHAPAEMGTGAFMPGTDPDGVAADLLNARYTPKGYDPE